jgi:hypothetical protein
MRRLVLSVLSLLLAAAPLAGQTLRERFDSLFHFGNCAELLCLPVDPAQHGSHFIPALQKGDSNVTSFVTNAIGITVSNIPISAATSGAVWSRSESGLPVRTATSSGPIFAERAQTLGRNHVLFGASLTNFNFTTIRGVSLDDLVFDFTHVDVDPSGLGNPDFENDVLEVRTKLDVNLFAVTGVLTYGLLDAVDIGVAVPLVHTSMSGTSLAQIIPAEPQTPHRFGTDANPSLTASAASSGSATGIGDVAGRIKARLVQGKQVGVALVGEVRFPTGKEENLLGSGEYSARGVGIISARYGTFTPHLNVGYNYRGGDFENDAVLATLGFDQFIGSWATFAADVISEWQVGTSKLEQPQPVVINTPLGSGTSARIVPPSNIPDSRDDVVLGSFGFKFTAPSGITVVTNAVIPVHRGFLQPDVAWTAGLEYSF